MSNILAIGAHSDDIEFGCYGTLFKHIRKGDKVFIVIMSVRPWQNPVYTGVGGFEYIGEGESEQSADYLGATFRNLHFQDKYVPFNADSIEKVEKVIVAHKIDTIYTHWGGDTHQDHLNTLNTTLAAGRLVRNVLCYEQVPLPRVALNYPVANYYVDITDYYNEKVKCCKMHKSQIKKYSKQEFDVIDGLEVLARYRGNQIKVKYAEAFDVLKMVGLND